MPTYSPNIPQPGDMPSQSQNLILENFQVINTGFSQDHSAYNSPTQGQHKQITFPVGPLTGQPFTYLSGQIGLQNITAAPTARPDIWMSRGVSAAFPITGYGIAGTQGWSYLPSGALMIWGRSVINPGLQKTIIYNDTANGGVTGFPGFTVNASPTVVRIRSGSSTTAQIVYVDSTTTLTQLVVDTNGNTTNYDFYWSVIGF